MRDSRNCQALFCFMSDERNGSWWNEQQAFRYDQTSDSKEANHVSVISERIQRKQRKYKAKQKY